MSRVRGFGRSVWVDDPERVTPNGIAGLPDDVGVTIRGGGCSYGDAAIGQCVLHIPPSPIPVLQADILRVESVVSLCGSATIQDCDSALRSFGMMLPVVPGTARATIAGCIANDVHGKNQHVSGTFSTHVSKIALRLEGGRVAETVPGERLFMATVGGLGTTGVILGADIRLVSDLGSAFLVTETKTRNLTETLSGLSQSNYSVAWVDMSAETAAVGRAIVIDGEPTKQRVRPAPQRKAVPVALPLVNSFTSRAFCALKYHTAPETKTRLVSRDQFLYPLDRLAGWPSLYGRQGLVQFHAVFPDSIGEAAVREALLRIKAHGHCSPLAILKRFGPQERTGYLGFVSQGVSLAVDLPASTQGLQTVRELGRYVAEVGGRVYPAKDQVITQCQFQQMYKDGYPEQLAALDQYAPRRRWRSQMTARYGLTP